MRRHSLAAWLFLSMLLIASTLGFGQAGSTSAIQGTVQDKTGAAIVGADVTVSSPSTGFSRTVKTTSDGTYRVDPIAAGTYTVTANMPGFGPAKAERVETLVNAAATQNLTLVAGATKETVEVTAEAPPRPPQGPSQ